VFITSVRAELVECTKSQAAENDAKESQKKSRALQHVHS